jgi:hypothetical protein
MQNKANFKKIPMSTTTFIKTTYENFHRFLQRKNKPKTKPICKMAKMNAYSFIQRTYDEILPFYRQKNKAKTNPISKTPKNERNLIYNKGL